MRPKKDKARQTRLTFEATGDASPSRLFAPANVRFTDSRGAGGAKLKSALPIHDSPKSSPSKGSATKNRKMQTTLKGSMGTFSGSEAGTPSQKAASFMPKLRGKIKRRAAVDDNDSEDEDDEIDLVHQANSDGSEDELSASVAAPKSSQSVSTRLRRTILDDDDEHYESQDDEVSLVPVLPQSASKRSRRAKSDDDDDNDDGEVGEEEEDEDDIPLPTSAKRRRQPIVIELDDSDDSDVSPAKKRKVARASSSAAKVTPSRRLIRRGAQDAPSSPMKRKGHRSQKEKQKELLKRRKAGEKIDKLTSSEDDDDAVEDARGLYDSDGEDGFEMLQEFEDESSEDEPPQPVASSSKKRSPMKSKVKARKSAVNDSGTEEGHEDEDDLDDFIDEDGDDGPIGAPVDIWDMMPAEFTGQGRKPLKDQFPYVVEWLVQNKINPAFERDHGSYNIAWRKLNDEVRGLANSKFTSAAWKPDFSRTLNARPTLESVEIGTRPGIEELFQSCEACGRSGHPATWTLTFSGQPYDKETLIEIESDSEDSENDGRSVDSKGNELPSAEREWLVGSTCYSNAETAHTLIHWKHALKEWVEERLEDEHHLTAQKLKEREKMSSKKRRAAADKIVDDWAEDGVIASLFGDFKKNLEDAQFKTTTGRGRWK